MHANMLEPRRSIKFTNTMMIQLIGGNFSVKEHTLIASCMNCWPNKSFSWAGKSTELSLSNVWETTRPKRAVDKLHKGIWVISIPKVGLFLWPVKCGKLPTANLIIKQGEEANIICSLCRNSNESIKHVFFDCAYWTGHWRNPLQQLEAY